MPQPLVQQTDNTLSRNRANKKHKEKRDKEMTATLVTEGNPLLRADIVIEVQGVAELHSGLWYVVKCKHDLSKGSGYITTLELTKNATNKPASTNAQNIVVGTNGIVNTATEVNKPKTAPTNEQGVKIPKYNENGKVIK